MKVTQSALAVSMMLVLGLSACSTQQSSSSGEPAKSKEQIRAEKVAAKEDAEAKKYPAPPASSKLSKVKKDMTESEVRDIMGPPDNTESSTSGKQWIPGYGSFAPDINRVTWIYKGEGYVIMNQNRYNGRLFALRAVYDPKR
jgi:hypothetical protein